MGPGVCLCMAVVTREELLSERCHREKGSGVYRLRSEVEQLVEEGCFALETLQHKAWGLVVSTERGHMTPKENPSVGFTLWGLMEPEST